MYKVETDQGQYAVKALNPEIMQRPGAFNNFIVSEKIAQTAKNNGFPAIAAIETKGNIIHNVDGQNYLVFPWVNGTSIPPQSVSSAHCKIIGKTLAQLHATDFSSSGMTNNVTNTLQDINWNEYVSEAQEKQTEWENLLKDHQNNLFKWCRLVNNRAAFISENMIISHRDFDSKNILWDQNQIHVVDWESAGYVNPLAELTETACNWAGYNELEINREKFLCVINSYDKVKEIPRNTDWQAILENNLSSKIEWLEYNIHRSLQLKCVDKEEQKLGTQETLKTIPRIAYYAEMIPTLTKWLKIGLKST